MNPREYPRFSIYAPSIQAVKYNERFHLEHSCKGNYVNTSKHALSIGKAGEYLVCCDLTLAGYEAFPTGQGLPYDVVLDFRGKLLRMQVKSNLVPRKISQRSGERYAYQYSCRRAGKGSKRVLGNDEFDILALVALDIRCVAYIPIDDRVRQTVHLHIPGSYKRHNKVHQNIDEYPIHLALQEIGLLT